MFACTAKAEELRQRLLRFMDEHIYPNEAALLEHEQGPDRWQPPALVETLKEKARDEGLWNLFLPESEHGAGLSNLDYAHLCEIMGRSPFAPEVFNCAAPDTGNMEVLARYGTDEQKRRWLLPLLAGEIRSCFSMTEPAVASSDATNIECSIRRDGALVHFQICDKETNSFLNVTYTGKDPLPDTFRDEAQAMADGKLSEDGTFHASAIAAKCPSKYEADTTKGKAAQPLNTKPSSI